MYKYGTRSQGRRFAPGWIGQAMAFFFLPDENGATGDHTILWSSLCAFGM